VRIVRPERKKQAAAALPWGTESPNLDFLRANAVLMVLVFHVASSFGIRQLGPFDLEAMGMFGVLSFFVHTSFVLMLSLRRQMTKLGRQKLFLIFMGRRCFRIYPLSICVVALILLFKLPLSGHPWAMTWADPLSPIDILSNFLLTQNLTGSTPLEGPLWSLSYEVQMYLLLPALFVLTKRLRSPWLAVAGWFVVAVGIFILRRLGYGLLLQYIPCFLSGIIAYKFSGETQPRWAFWGWPILLWALTALFALSGRLGVGWLVCFVMGMALPRFVEVRSIFIQRVSYYISKYSYGFYLSHYFCQWFSFSRLRSIPAASQWMIFVVLLVLLPVLLYHLIEQPAITLGKKLIDERLAFSGMRFLAREAA